MQRIAPEEFFLLRVPQRSLTEYNRFPIDPCAIELRIRELAESEGFQHALLVSSPGLHHRLQKWLAKDARSIEPAEIKRDERLIISVYKYWSRACTRATPFGTFAGVALGKLGDTTSLKRLAPEASELAIDLDSTVLRQVAARILEASPSIPYRINRSLLRREDEVRYVEGFDAISEEAFKYSKAEVDRPLEAALAIFIHPVSLDVAKLRLASQLDEFSPVEIASYIEELKRHGVIVPCMPFSPVGKRSSIALIESVMQSLEPSGLREVRDLICAPVRLANSGAVISRALALVSGFVQNAEESMPLRITTRVRMRTRSLGKGAIKAVPLLLEAAAVGMKPSRSILDDFRENFREKYGSRSVPLLEAIDPVSGLAPLALDLDDESPCAGIPFAPRDSKQTPDERPVSKLQKLILQKFLTPGRAVEAEIELDTAELHQLARQSDTGQMPASFSMLASVYVDKDGADIIHFKGCHGPSGVNLIGRFCDLDEELTSYTREHLRWEEEVNPNAVFAEIVSWPRGKGGNVTERPALRLYEIPLVAESSVPNSKQIALSDLYVSIDGDEVCLWSKALMKRVVPTLTCAHNFSNATTGSYIYKFLCMIARQRSLLPKIAWPSILTDAPVLPRVRFQNLILLAKRWRIPRKYLEGIILVSGEIDDIAWAELSAQYGLDRFVEFINMDNRLAIDLLNPIALKALMRETAGISQVVLYESLQCRFASAVVDGDGNNYGNELIVPFRNLGSNAYGDLPQGIFPSSHNCVRTFLPGDGWVTLKIYGNRMTLDDLLISRIFGLCDELIKERIATQWFYLRYTDPKFHLRCRLRVRRAGCYEAVVGAFSKLIKEADKGCGALSLISDSYVREIERYGGSDESIRLAEQAFCDQTSLLSGTIIAGADFSDCSQRWKVAMLACHHLVERLDPRSKAMFVRGLRQGLADRYFEDRATLRSALGSKFRELGVIDFMRDAIGLRTAEGRCDSFLSEYEGKARQMVIRLRMLEAGSLLNRPVDQFVGSLMHMMNNRVFRSDSILNEMMIYDHLSRWYLYEENSH